MQSTSEELCLRIALRYVLITHVDGLVHDCCNSIANALELLQSCTKPSIWLSQCQGSNAAGHGKSITRIYKYWWRHQMEIYSAPLAICAGNSPAQRPVMRSFDVFFNLRLIKRLSKQSRGWWFETPSGSLWRHCNDAHHTTHMKNSVCKFCGT